MTASTSASISGMYGATETTRSRCSNRTALQTSVLLVHARTKTTVLGRPWAFPGPATGNRSRPTTARTFRQPRRYACHIFVDRPLRVSMRYFRKCCASPGATAAPVTVWPSPSLRAVLPLTSRAGDFRPFSLQDLPRQLCLSVCML